MTNNIQVFASDGDEIDALQSTNSVCVTFMNPDIDTSSPYLLPTNISTI